MVEQRGNVRVESGQKRVRTYLGGELVADTARAMYVWEIPYYPAYYLPLEDVRGDLLVPTATITHSPSRGDGASLHGEGRRQGGGRRRVDLSRLADRSTAQPRPHRLGGDGQLVRGGRGGVRPPARPLPTRRLADQLAPVRVEIDGVVVAESSRPTLLFETGLPARYYLPQTDVRMDMLTPTDTVTQCPYKGTARFWSVRTGDTTFKDIAWSYPTPLPESIKVAGLVAFYNERVDIWVDGELERGQRPRSRDRGGARRRDARRGPTRLRRGRSLG